MIVSVVAMGATGAGAVSDAGTESRLAGAVDSTDLAVDRTTVGDAAAERSWTNGVTVHESLEDERGEVEVMVRFRPADVAHLSEDRAVEALQRHAEATQSVFLEWARDREGVAVENTFWLANAVLATVDTDRVEFQEFSTFDHVDRVHPNFEMEVPGPVTSDEGVTATDDDVTYGLDQINAPRVWDEFDTRGEDVRVAVLDTGVDTNHPDLELYTDDPADPTYPGGWAEFDSNGERIPDSQPRDSAYHGTHTSGTVVGSADPDGDVPAYGVAPGADLMHGMVIPNGSGTNAQVIAGMEWAVETDADVISMSLGSPGPDEAMVEPSENARQAGVVLVASSGNSGPGLTGSPGNVYPNVAVGASDPNHDIADFSSGEVMTTEDDYPGAPDYWPEEYVVPNVAAPGVGVTSADSGGGYRTISGTSMAAPHVAGTYALMMSASRAEREELNDALEGTAWKPDGEPDEPDVRYGHGIVDAYEATSEVHVEVRVPEYELGDVDRDGQVAIQDVIRTQQRLAGIPVDDFDPYLADLNRDGSIGVLDLIMIQQKVVGMLDPATVTVDGVRGPDDARNDEPFNVTANVTNHGDEGALQYVNVTFAEDEAGLDDAPVAGTQAVDLAPGETRSVRIEVDPARIAGDLAVGVASDDDEHTSTMTVEGSVFEVAAIDAPDVVDDTDADVDVTATIENAGTEADTQNIEFRFDDLEEPFESRDLQLDPDESQNVTFGIDATEFPQDEYRYAILTEDRETVATLSKHDAWFQVSIDDGDGSATFNETVSADVTIENVGDGAGEQTIEYEVEPTEFDVAVLEGTHPDGYDPAEMDWADVIAAELDEALPDDQFNVDYINHTHVPERMNEYDTFVVQRFQTYHGSDLVYDAFQDGLADHHSVVYLGTWGERLSTFADGVISLHRERDDPGTVEPMLNGVGEDNYYHIVENHPIFDGVGSAGDTVRVKTTDNHQWFDDYSGDVLADISTTGDEDDVNGSAVGIDEEKGEVLIANLGYGSAPSDGPDHRTDAGDLVVANAVAYVSGYGTVGAADATAEPTTTETVELGPGNSTTFTFEQTIGDHEDVNLELDYTHKVSSEDVVDREPIEIEYDTGDVDVEVSDDFTGDLVEDALVELDAADGRYEGPTDANGRTTFADVAVSDLQEVELSVTAASYEPHVEPVAVRENETTTVQVDLQPEPSSISGTVIAADTGEPLEDAAVEAENEDGDTFTATTDADGQYAIDELNEGGYVVSVVDAGDGYVTEAVVSLGPGEDVTGVDLTVDPVPGLVVGQVTDHEDQPIENATVFDADDGDFEATTGADGTYELDLDPGTYALRATADEKATSNHRVVEVPKNGTVEQNFSLDPAPATVSGTVTDADTGTVLDDATVELIDDDGTVVAEATTDANGEYDLEVEAGNYTMNVTRYNYEHETRDVALEVDEETVHDFALEELPASMKGQVFDSDTGDPLEGATVEIFDHHDGDLLASDTANETGHYDVGEFDAGDVDLLVSHEGYEPFEFEGVTAHPGIDFEEDWSLDPLPATVSGTVTGADTGDGIENATVELIDDDGTVVAEATTDPNGECDLGDVDADTYTLEVSHDDYEDDSRPVDLDPGEDAREDFVLSVPETALGSVTSGGTLVDT